MNLELCYQALFIDTNNRIFLVSILGDACVFLGSLMARQFPCHRCCFSCIQFLLSLLHTQAGLEVLKRSHFPSFYDHLSPVVLKPVSFKNE